MDGDWDASLGATKQICQEFEDRSNAHVPVRGFLHRPAVSAADCLILTHGAGSNCQSPLLIALADAFCSFGLMVLRCDLPFRQSRPHGPPPRGSAAQDQEGLRAAIASMRTHDAGKLYLGGHSYGGRQASMLAADDCGLVEGLLLLSYPLHPPKLPSELRIKHFPSLRTPALFVHGTADEFGSTEEMEAALKLIPARTELLEISGSGHELMTRPNRGRVQQEIVQRFVSFCDLCYIDEGTSRG